MKTKIKMYFYQVLGVLFSLFFVLSLQNIGETYLINTVTHSGFFFLAAKECFKRENMLCQKAQKHRQLRRVGDKRVKNSKAA